MIYNVTINDKVYEVEVEKGKANLVRTTDVVAAPAPAAATAAAPAAAPAAAAPAPAAGPVSGTPVPAPLPGTILKINVTAGQAVKEGDLVVVLEAMKMENEIYAPCAGTVGQILTSKGATVATDDVLLTLS